jgi:CheY-like chemotaxis protein
MMPDQAVILLVEDREDDILLIQRAFEKAYINNPVQIVRDGEEAIAYLRGVGKYANRAEYPLPDLMLLDLKLPGIDGLEVLRWVREQPGLSCLRVVVLTSSDDMRDVNAAYRLGANSFLVKPMDFDDIVQLSKSLTTYWLRLSKTPECSRRSRPKNAPEGTTSEGYEPST